MTKHLQHDETIYTSKLSKIIAKKKAEQVESITYIYQRLDVFKTKKGKRMNGKTD